MADTEAIDPAPALPNGRLAAIFAALDLAGLAAEAAWLRQRIETAGAAWRIADRDDALFAVAALLGDFQSGNSMARGVHAALTRYATRGAWRFERGASAPEDPLRRAMHAVLSLGEGEFPTVRQLRRIFAGIGHGNGQQNHAKAPRK